MERSQSNPHLGRINHGKAAVRKTHDGPAKEKQGAQDSIRKQRLLRRGMGSGFAGKRF